MSDADDDSVRIETQKTYTHGLFILDLKRVPWGCGKLDSEELQLPLLSGAIQLMSPCSAGVSSAFRTTNDNWPRVRISLEKCFGPSQHEDVNEQFLHRTGKLASWKAHMKPNITRSPGVQLLDVTWTLTKTLLVHSWFVFFPFKL